MAKFLVTGATGFIGRHLVEALLRAGHEVACLVRPNSPHAGRLAGFELRICPGDVTTGDGLVAAVADQDFVFHLAGLTRALSRSELFRVNGEGVGRLLTACAQVNDPPTVVLLSSLAAGGPALGGRPVDVDDPPRPVSNYGRSKLAGECEAARFAARVPLTIVRPPIVFGGGDPYTLMWFQSLARFRLHMVPGLVDSRFSLIYVADLVEVLLLAAARGERLPGTADEAGPTGRGVYYAAHPETVGYAELGRRLAQALQLRRCFCPRVPMSIVRAFGGITEAVAQVLRRPAWVGWDKTREAAAGSWICSSRTVIESLGFGFPSPLDVAFEATVESYREAGNLPRKVGPRG